MHGREFFYLRKIEVSNPSKHYQWQFHPHYQNLSTDLSLWLHGCLTYDRKNKGSFIQDKTLVLISYVNFLGGNNVMSGRSVYQLRGPLVVHATHATSHCRNFLLILWQFNHNGFSCCHQRWHTASKAANMASYLRNEWYNWIVKRQKLKGVLGLPCSINQSCSNYFQWINNSSFDHINIFT